MREISPDELKRIMSGMSDEHYKTSKHVESWVTLRIPAEFVSVLDDVLKTASNLVRCKDCKWYCPRTGCCNRNAGIWTDDDFCSYAEWRGDNETD